MSDGCMKENMKKKVENNTDVPAARQDEMKTKSVVEGEPVTLHPGVTKTPNVVMTWYCNETLIAEITGDQNSGEYKLQIRSSRFANIRITSLKSFSISITGSSGVVADDRSTFLTEGDSVTLNTGVKINQQDVVLWYFNNSRIAAIAGDLSFICTDVQCKNDTERFRNRLKLDHQTGSLTIMNITNTDSGGYMLQVCSGSTNTSILVCVSDVPAARRDEMKTKSVVEGEPVTLHPGVTKTPNVVMTWYCNETLIAEITGDQSKICSDLQCKERFRDRLKLDHQTGSLTITNTRTTDSGEYKLQIRSSRFANIRITSLKSFSISITGIIHSIHSIIL
ncbi:uncharacterized protein LOC132159252 [Carassius carassius]|uniref:uncharacterized protein LOC132159252 n=1 Tax=Carassius carassius TaxID=217509 RepID=UPI0028685DCE|nr:uncharacterized protein LOC132159252 [Carassius carassius]